jgi:hypothetical protein
LSPKSNFGLAVCQWRKTNTEVMQFSCDHERCSECSCHYIFQGCDLGNTSRLTTVKH